MTRFSQYQASSSLVPRPSATTPRRKIRERKKVPFSLSNFPTGRGRGGSGDETRPHQLCWGDREVETTILWSKVQEFYSIFYGLVSCVHGPLKETRCLVGARVQVALIKHLVAL